MWDLLTALLIVSPVEMPVPHRAPGPAWQALKRVALQLEVVGPHERWIDDYRSEVGYVRRHWRELLAAPPLADSLSLPSAGTMQEWRCFNLGYQRTLELRLPLCLHREDELRAALREAQQLYEIWTLVDTATCPAKSWVCRRRGLEQLRELIGLDAYYTGTLPPFVPLWRFQPGR
jgi:hypothetical protein